MKKFGMLLFNDAQPMDIIGPWEVFTFYNKVSTEPLEMYLISEHGGSVKLDSQITLLSDCDFATAPQCDYFFVPGGVGRLVQTNNTKLINFIKQQATYAEYILSICTGMFLLNQAGLLKDKKITTYWLAYPELKQLNNVNIVEERIIKNSKIWFSGGVTSGIDLSLEFVATVFGEHIAGQTQLLLEYFPENKIYAKRVDIKSLPKYQGRIVTSDDLPEYIRKLGV